MQNKSDLPYICSSCGNCGCGEISMKVPFIVEGIVWLAAIITYDYYFPIPLAIVFSIWRRYTAKTVCNVCEGDVVSMSSPVGKELFARYHVK